MPLQKRGRRPNEGHLEGHLGASRGAPRKRGRLVSMLSIVFFSDYYFNANALSERCVEERLRGLKDVFQTESHIFIDDFHDFAFAVAMLSYSFPDYNLSFATLARSFQLNDEIENIWQFVLSQICLPSHKLLWVCFDSLQSPVNAFEHQLGALEDWKSKITVHELSANLRNSYEIAFFLDFIRNERLANINKRIAICYSTSYRDSLSYIPFDVKQDIGHYIHGPTPRICLVDVHGRKKNTVAGYLADFLTNELSKLVGCSSVAIIHDDYGQRSKDFNGHNYVGLEDVCQQSKEQIDRDYLACGMGLQVHHFDEIASLEWPAVIGIIEVDDRDRIPLENLDGLYTFCCNYDPVFFETFNFSKDRVDAFLTKMYQITSRARVYCTLILVSNFKKPISTFIRNPSKIDDEERPPEFGFDSDIDFPFSTIGISTKEYKSVKLTNQYYYFIINKALQKDEIKDQLIEGLKNCGLDPEDFKKPINLPNEEISKIIRNFNGIKPWIGEFVDRMTPFVINNFHSHACIDKEMIEICDKKDIDYPSQLEVALLKANFIFSKADSDNETAQKTEQEKEVKTDEGEDEKVEAEENKTDEGEDEKVEAEENKTDGGEDEKVEAEEDKTDGGEDEKVEAEENKTDGGEDEKVEAEENKTDGGEDEKVEAEENKTDEGEDEKVEAEENKTDGGEDEKVEAEENKTDEGEDEKVEAEEDKTDGGEDEKVEAEENKTDEGEDEKVEAEENKTDEGEDEKVEAEENKTDEGEDEKVEAEENKTDEGEDEKVEAEENKTDEGEDEKVEAEENKTDEGEDEKVEAEENKTDGGEDEKVEAEENKTDEGEDEKVEAEENKTDEGEDEKVEAEENRTDEDKTDEGEDEKVEAEENRTDENKTDEGEDEKVEAEENKTDGGEDEKVEAEENKTDEGEDEKVEAEEDKTDGGEDEKVEAEENKTDEGEDEKVEAEENKTDEGEDEKVEAEENKTDEGEDEKVEAEENKTDEGEDEKVEAEENKTDEGEDEKVEAEENKTDEGEDEKVEAEENKTDGGEDEKVEAEENKTDEGEDEKVEAEENKTDEGEDEKVEAEENRTDEDKTDEGEDEKVEAEENRTDENKTDEGEDEKVESGYNRKRCFRLDYEAMTPEVKFFMWSIQIEMERHLKKTISIDYKPPKSD